MQKRGKQFEVGLYFSLCFCLVYSMDATKWLTGLHSAYDLMSTHNMTNLYGVYVHRTKCYIVVNCIWLLTAMCGVCDNVYYIQHSKLRQSMEMWKWKRLREWVKGWKGGRQFSVFISFMDQIQLFSGKGEITHASFGIQYNGNWRQYIQLFGWCVCNVYPFWGRKSFWFFVFTRLFPF